MSTTDFFDLWLHVLALATYGGATLAVVADAAPGGERRSPIRRPGGRCWCVAYASTIRWPSPRWASW